MIGTTTITEGVRGAIRKRLRTPRQRNQMARKIGCNRTYLAMVYSGKAKSLPFLLRIADELGITIEVRVDGQTL